jgi:hypothetical protein
MIPKIRQSHDQKTYEFNIPPKMLMKIDFTLESARRISNAFLTVSGVAPLLVSSALHTIRYKGDVNEPADVKEVGWLTTVERKHVHGGHGKTGTVHQAADITVKLDEVEVGLLRLDLGGLLLRDVAEVEDVLLTELGVVIKAELGVHAVS